MAVGTSAVVLSGGEVVDGCSSRRKDTSKSDILDHKNKSSFIKTRF
jgi:hypothetical protein